MVEDKEFNENAANNEKEDIFSNAVRAGKRTYFFDVKETRKNDRYITITESKKRYNRDGHFFYEKHKIFLYKEDFEKFLGGLSGAVDFINQSKVEEKNGLDDSSTEIEVVKDEVVKSYTNIEFEDLEVEIAGQDTVK